MDFSPEASVGPMLARLRLAAGLTQSALARRAGISRRTLGLIERGVTDAPQQATLDLLADALGLDPEERDRLRRVSRAADDRLGGGRRPVPVLPNRAGGERDHPLLGRDAEATALRSLLRPSALVTLTGVGGVGKSRLALEVVAAEAAAGRVVHVAALESLETTEAALAAIAATLGAPPGLDAAAALAGLLGPGAVLLLDDADRVHDAAPAFAAIAAATPHATVLVTCRRPLGVPGERTLPLLPFDVASLRGARRPSAERLRDHPGVSLFLQRAHGHADDLEAVAGVVAAVDGLPLAIELAAAQTVHLSPAAILLLLEASGGALLTRRSGAAAGALGRHATMTAAIAWSTDRLPEPARDLLSILGAFRGGLGDDALGETLEALGAGRLLDAVPDLVRAGLVHRAAGGRLSMLEPVRFFAEDALESSPERRRIRLSHARRFARWATRTGEAALGPDVDAALAAEAADRPNALAAARAALAEGDLDTAATVVAGLFRLWEAAALHRTVAPLVEALADRAEEIGDPQARAMARYLSGYLAIQFGERGLARARLLELESGDAFARALGALAASLSDGADPDALEPALREAQATLAAAGHPFAWMPGLQLAGAAIAGNRQEEALAVLRNVLAGLEERGDRFDLPPVLYPLGSTLTDFGRLAEARDVLRRDVAVCREHGFRMALLQALTAFAEAAGLDERQDLMRTGATLLGAVAAFNDRIGVPEPPSWRQRRTAVLAHLAARLDPAELARLDAAGRRLALDEAAAVALATSG